MAQGLLDLFEPAVIYGRLGGDPWDEARFYDYLVSKGVIEDDGQTEAEARSILVPIVDDIGYVDFCVHQGFTTYKTVVRSLGA